MTQSHPYAIAACIKPQERSVFGGMRNPTIRLLFPEIFRDFFETHSHRGVESKKMLHLSVDRSSTWLIDWLIEHCYKLENDSQYELDDGRFRQRTHSEIKIRNETSNFILQAEANLPRCPRVAHHPPQPIAVKSDVLFPSSRRQLVHGLFLAKHHKRRPKVQRFRRAILIFQPPVGWALISPSSARNTIAPAPRSSSVSSQMSNGRFWSSITSTLPASRTCRLMRWKERCWAAEMAEWRSTPKPATKMAFYNGRFHHDPAGVCFPLDCSGDFL